MFLLMQVNKLTLSNLSLRRTTW